MYVSLLPISSETYETSKIDSIFNSIQKIVCLLKVCPYSCLVIHLCLN